MTNAEFLRKVCRHRDIACGLMLILAVAGALCVFCTTVADTFAIGRQRLGEATYHARMFDSYLYSAVVLLAIGLPGVLLVRRFFAGYIRTVGSLSAQETAWLVKRNGTASLLNRYLPPYIIRERSIVILFLFYSREIRFADMTKIDVARARREDYYVTVYTGPSFTTFLVSESRYELSLSIDQARKINPQIVICFP